MSTENALGYPLRWPDGWPRKSSWDRADGHFRNNSHSRALKSIQHELALLQGRYSADAGRPITISTNVAVRQDGLPYAQQRKIDDPGVAIYFHYKGNQHVMARDAYRDVHDNIRSLALAIEHLRGLERHGGGVMMDKAFSGFKALPAPESKKSWWDVLGVREDSSVEDVKTAFRQLAIVHHPDKGGSDERYRPISDAYREGMRASSNGPGNG